MCYRGFSVHIRRNHVPELNFCDVVIRIYCLSSLHSNVSAGKKVFSSKMEIFHAENGCYFFPGSVSRVQILYIRGSWYLFSCGVGKDFFIAGGYDN